MNQMDQQTDDVQHCLGIIDKLTSVFSELEHYIEQEQLWDEELVTNLHLRRQQLTASLFASMPNPMPLQLETVVRHLHTKTQSLLSQFAVSQHDARDAVLKLQSHRKAKNVYQQVGNH